MLSAVRMTGARGRPSLRPAFSPSRVAAAKVPSILDEACLAEFVALRVPRTSTTRPSHSLSAVKPNPADECATGDALEATRLRRVLHCVPALGATQGVAWVPQASARHNPAHAGGE